MKATHMVTDLQLDEVGSRLFGSKERLRLLIWIAGLPVDRFYVAQYTGGVGNSGNHAGTLRRLADLNMVKEDENYEGACKWFERLEHPLWEIILLTREMFLGRSVWKPVGPDDLLIARGSLVELEEALR